MSARDNERLTAVLSEGVMLDPPYIFHGNAPVPTTAESNTVSLTLDLCQWQVGANNTFRPAAKTVPKLPAGAYSVNNDRGGPFLGRQNIVSDDIVILPETVNVRVLQVIRKFWGSRKRYNQHGLLFKRGVLLWGPPGSGKTVTVNLLIQDLIQKDGVVIFCGHPETTGYLLSSVRRIEPRRPLILVLEDIDEIIKQYGEHTILSILDGELQTDNIVSIATTNYPELLGARIVNRPSRFDDRIYVGMPSELARSTYLKKAVGAISIDIATWVKDTEGLSIAHLRELVAAVLCLDQEYNDVLERLRSMNERPKDVDGFARRTAGFGLAQAG